MSDVTWTRTEDVVVWQSTQNPATVWRVETGTPSGGGGGTGVEWPVVGTPAEFPPEAHEHGIDDITTAETSTSKVLQPDGSGGVAWGTVSGGVVGCARPVGTTSGAVLTPPPGLHLIQRDVHVAIARNEALAIPMCLPAPWRLQEVGVWVTTAGAQLWIALYDDPNGEMQAGSKIYDPTPSGNYDASTGGWKSTAGINTLIPAGNYVWQIGAPYSPNSAVTLQSFRCAPFAVVASNHWAASLRVGAAGDTPPSTGGKWPSPTNSTNGFDCPIFVKGAFE